MLAKDILIIDAKFEEKYPVDEWKISGIRVWPLIRVMLNFQLQRIETGSNMDSKDKIRKNMPRVGRILKTAAMMFQNGSKSILGEAFDYAHRDNVHKADVFFLTDNQDRMFSTSDGTLYDRVLDPIRDSLVEQGFEAYSMEVLAGVNKLRLPRYSKSNFFQLKSDYFLAQAFIDKKKIGTSEIILPKFERFLLDCAEQGCILNFNFLLKQVSYIKKTKTYFKNIFKRCGTKLVVTRCWYGIERMALCTAAKEMGIHVVDVQHGVAGGAEHHIYCQWKKMPAEGYELVPDVFWCNSEADADAIRQWNNADLHTKVIVGGRSLQLFWNSYKGKELLSHYMEQFRSKVALPDNAKVVLFSLQTLNKNTERYPEWLPNFIAEHDEFFWLIRRHPMMDETQKDFLGKIEKISNVNVEEASSYPLDVVLEFSDVHVTMFSTVAMEAAEHGVATVFLADSRDFSAVVSKEYIFHGLSYDTLYDSLNKGVSRRSNAEKEMRGIMAIRELEALVKKT